MSSPPCRTQAKPQTDAAAIDRYWYGTCNGYNRGLLHGQTPLACGANITRPASAPDYNDIGPTMAGWTADPLRAQGPRAGAITDVRLTSALEGAWKVVKDEDEAEWVNLIKGINFVSTNGVFRSYPGVLAASHPTLPPPSSKCGCSLTYAPFGYQV